MNHGQLSLLVAVAMVTAPAATGLAVLGGEHRADHAGDGAACPPTTAGEAAVACRLDPASAATDELEASVADRTLQFDASRPSPVGSALQEQVVEAFLDGQPARPVSVLVTYDRTPTAVDEARLASAGAQVVWVFDRVPVIHARVPAQTVGDVAELAGVDRVEWDAPRFATLDTAAPAVQAREFHGDGPGTVYNGRTGEALGYTGEGSVVAVLDTGVDDSHPAFEGKWLAGASTTGRTLECVNPIDDDGHGTHVAGIALGNETGSDFEGSAPAADLVEVKVSSGPVDATSGIMRAWEWVLDYNQAIANGDPKCGVGADDRIDVATLSFGGCCPKTAGEAEEQLIEALTEAGVVVTIAAGNSGGEICGPQTPPCRSGEQHSINAPGVAAGAITVGNVDENETVTRTDDRIAPSSSRGPNEPVTPENLTDRFRKPEVAAPGTDITAPDFTGGYRSLTGTSMATPLVAGVAAQLVEAGREAAEQTGQANALHPSGTGYVGNQDWASGEHPVRDALAMGAENHTDGVPQDMLDKWTSPGIGDRTWNNAFGYGEVNAFLSLCWAWDHVLEEQGAQPPALVDDRCPETTAPGDPESGPDLTVQAVDLAPLSPRAGDEAAIEATVAATGEAVSTPFEVAFRVDGEVLDTATVDGLGADEEVTLRSAPWTATKGEHSFSAVVDADDAVDETDEENNELQRSVEVRNPAIYALDLDLPDEAGAGNETFVLEDEHTNITVHMDCPDAEATVSVIGGGNVSTTDSTFACAADLPPGTWSNTFREGTYRITWQAAGTGSVSYEITGVQADE